jgi:hypothetical protein
MAEVLAAWIDEHPDLPPTPTADRAGSSPSGPVSEGGGHASEDGVADDAVADVTEATGDWAVDQSVGLVARAGVPLAVLVAGSWSLWAHLSWRRRRARVAHVTPMTT